MELAREPVPGHARRFAAEQPPPAELPERYLDRVPEWVLPTAYREIGIGIDPATVAAEHGLDSPELATLCRRGYIRVAATALDRSASEAVRRMWDTLEAVDSRAIRAFGDHDRETYFRDEAAWQAVFYDHARRNG